MERSIQDAAHLAGTTSRALRHYGELGILEPSRIGQGGHRYYDGQALVRLQRIRLLRDLGVGLAEIAAVLAEAADEADALEQHASRLLEERDLLDRRIRAVQSTIEKLREGRPLVAEEMFDGFDHTAYRAEVEQEWGADAYAGGDAWWRSKTADERREWMSRQRSLASDWAAAAEAGIAPESEEAQTLARRQVDRLGEIPGLPRVASGALDPDYIIGLGELYVADERFAMNYGGPAGASLVRDALAQFVAGTR